MRRAPGSLVLVMASFGVLAAAGPVRAQCEIRPGPAKWCGGATIPWGYGTGLSTAITGTPGRIRTQVLSAMQWLDAEFAARKIPIHFVGPYSTPLGGGITFTYGATEQGTLDCDSEGHYAKTYFHYTFKAGNAMGDLDSALVDFNDDFQGWTSTLAATFAYHEIGHALGLEHAFVTAASCTSGGARPLMYPTQSCTASVTADATFWRGLECLYGPTGPTLQGIKFDVEINGMTRIYKSSCSGSESCGSSALRPALQSAYTYDLSISENNGPFELFATLNEADWVENQYEHSFPRGYVNARIGIDVRDGGTVVRSAVSDAGNIEAPVTGVDPAAAPSLFLTAWPNPAVGRVRFRVESGGGLARVRLLDVVGRPVRTLHRGVLDRGPIELGWDGRDDSGRKAPAGVYYLEARLGGTRATRAIVLAR